MSKLTTHNCLAVVNPKLASEWHPTKNGELTAYDVTVGSDRKVWWLCKNGHEREQTISNRMRCPDCPICNSLAFKNPALASEWHPTKNGTLMPIDVYAGSSKKVWWLYKKCKHEGEAIIFNRNRGYGCPCCSNPIHKVCIDNCLATINPELAKEWHPTKNGKLTPYDVSYGSHKKVWWKCKKEHEWTDTIKNRKARNCPYCSGHKVCIDNCLTTKFPKLASEWHPTKNGKLTPYDVTAYSNKKVWWICRTGHVWLATISNRTQGRRCSKCRKINLKGGASCDSWVEAFFYLKYKKSKVRFNYHGAYGMGKSKYDFYFPLTNTYVEVTSYNKNSHRFVEYMEKIERKRKYVEKILLANFRFVYYHLTKKEKEIVVSHCI